MIKKDNQQNTEDIKILKIENEKLVNKINGLENSTRLTNIELHGVPEKQNENVDRMVVNLLKVVDPNFENTDVEACFRLKKPSSVDAEKKATQGRPILVKLKSKQTRMKLMDNRRKLSSYNFRDIGIETERVFMNENLTPDTKALFYQTNQQRKSLSWKYIWTRNGTIKVRKMDGSPIIIVQNLNDLQKIQ